MHEYASLNDLIDAPYVVRMIVLVDRKVKEKGHAIASDFQELSLNSRTTLDVAYGLGKYGVFKLDLVTKPRRMYMITLTDKGKRIASKFKEAVELFNEVSDDDDS